MIAPANPTDAHRRLGTEHNLSAALSHVAHRQVNNDYTVQLDGKFYQIQREGICPGLRGAIVRIEQRLDGSLAVRFRDRYLAVTPCGRVRPSPEPTPQPISKPAARPQPSPAMREP